MKHNKIYTFQPHLYKKPLIFILKNIQKNLEKNEILPYNDFQKVLAKFPDKNKNLFRRSHLIAGYHYLVSKNLLKKNDILIKALQMKPVRTQSGVTPVTVLTKPFPCPGACIFCPNDTKMPKSYLADEPGAQRAAMNRFDPYLQTYNRLLTFQEIGHNVEKVELIVLGGTWSFYPEHYQIWFIKRCFDAMNDFPLHDHRKKITTENIFKNEKPKHSKQSYNNTITKIAQGKFFSKNERATWAELEKTHKKNETAFCRNVGLVLETRPDYINEKEVIKLRRFGATKIQIGIQSTNDSVLLKNKRGHTQKETMRAIELLRLAGFKIHGHWMPNLYGATVSSDIQDYKILWTPPYSPDELKIYPTSIITNTELYKFYKQGKYKPYTYHELLKVLTNSIASTPRYVRLTRIVRDIPSDDIVAGNKFTNFRQIAENEILKKGKKLQDIRSREVKNLRIALKDLKKEKIKYKTTVSTEYFLSYKTKTDPAIRGASKIAGFLRLSIPKKFFSKNNFISEIRNCAMIREVHVYGQAVGIGQKQKGKAQHLGLGTKLIELASKIAKKSGYQQLAVISAVGTREYYRQRGFKDKGMYLTRFL